MNPLNQTTSLPQRILETLTEVLAGLLDSTRSLISQNGDNILMGILTLFVGWILASMLRGLTSKIFRALGLDVIADRTRFRAFLKKNDIQRPPSIYLGWGIYLLILYGTILSVFDQMGLDAISNFLRYLASYIPRALVVLILLGFGVGLGKLAAAFTARAARIAGLPVPQILGSIVRIGVMLFSLFLAINYLEWASQSVLIAGFALVIGLALALAILFTIAAKGLTESLLNHPFIKATYLPGDRINCPACNGEVIKIDAAATHIRSETGTLIVPNRTLAEQTVTIQRNAPK